MELKEKIKELRKAAGINKAQLGRMVEVSDVTIGYWESGAIKNIGSSHLLALSQAFGVSVSDLLDDPLKDKTGLEWAVSLCEDMIKDGYALNTTALAKSFNSKLESMA